MRVSSPALVTLLICCGLSVARGESPDTQPIKVNHLRIVAAMLSDAQSWTDRQIQGGYRVQNQPGTDRWRLLDPQDRAVSRGTREACAARLAKITEQTAVAAPRGEIVVLVHGLFQTRAKMETIERQILASGNYQVINFGYASTKANIETHARALEEVLSSLQATDRVSFVGHSMGCIVVRKLLAKDKGHAWRTGRVVMFGPPNQGAELARRLSTYTVIRRALGPGFDELARPTALDALPPLTCEFAVIAGSSPSWLLNSPLIAGDDDWIVGVNETALAGAKCKTCVSAHHGDIVHDRAALEATIDFLKRGQFSLSKDKEVK